MRRLLCAAALGLIVCASVAPAQAEDKPFPRRGAVLLLGYDPEAALRAKGLTELRSCLLWRKAGFDELGRAGDLAYSHGRAAGEARLSRQAMSALGGARHYCGKDEIAETFEKLQYDIAVALISAAPVKPEKQN